jgi:hypothetical protein
VEIRGMCGYECVCRKVPPESVRREIRGVGQKLWEQVIESMAQQLMELAWNSSLRNQ